MIRGHLPARIDRQSPRSPALLRGWEVAAQDVGLVAHGVAFDRHTAELLPHEVIDLGIGEAGVQFETAQVVDFGGGPDLAVGGGCWSGWKSRC